MKFAENIKRVVATVDGKNRSPPGLGQAARKGRYRCSIARSSLDRVHATREGKKKKEEARMVKFAGLSPLPREEAHLMHKEVTVVVRRPLLPASAATSKGERNLGYCRYSA